METQNTGIVMVCHQCGQGNRVAFQKLTQRAHCGACHAVLRDAGATVEINSSNEFSALIHYAKVPVLVDFWAPWCGPCRMMSPQLERFAKNHASDVIIAKVNVDEVQSVASRFAIRSIPTVILFSHQREVSRAMGAQSVSQLEDFLRQHSQRAA